MNWKNFLLTAVTFSSAFAFAQSSHHRIGVTIGGGSQKYSGDLGNGVRFKNDVWRGGVTLNAHVYMNPSFDLGVYGAIGDLGYCQPHDMKVTPVPDTDKCPGCTDRVGLGNLSSRMYSSGVMVRYKFNNNYLLKETSRIKPYVYSGVSINQLQDRMKMNCVVSGNYYTANAGAGFRLALNDRLFAGYNFHTGYFLSDGLDFLDRGGNDWYIHNSIFVGVELF